MFGQKNDSDDPDTTIPDESINAAVESTAQDHQVIEPSAPANPPFTLPSQPTNDNPVQDVISPAGGFPSPASDHIKSLDPAPTTYDGHKDEPATLVTSHDVADANLVDIKQKALGELSPLVDQLDQPPEEKFRTIMMMIQSSDDQSLVEKAFSAARSIEDKKARAQALLDVVNEINYFTQPPSDS